MEVKEKVAQTKNQTSNHDLADKLNSPINHLGEI